MTAVRKSTAADLVAALRAHYLPPGVLTNGGDEWSFLTEVPSTGSPAHTPTPRPPWDPDGDRATQEQALAAWYDSQKIRSIDVLLINNHRSGRVPFERIAIEVKVSRGDFLRETASKRGAWEALAHRFAYCVPRGMLRPEEIPSGCWLIEVDAEPCTSQSGPAHARHTPTRVHWHPKVKGARRTPAVFPTELAVHLARQASRAQETLRAGEGSAAAAATEQRLAKALARVHVLEGREYANRERVQQALTLVAPLSKQVCADCGAPIHPVVPAGYGTPGWKHRTNRQDNECMAARVERAGQQPERRYSGSFYSVEPRVLRQERERAEAEATESTEQTVAWREYLRGQG